MIKKIFSIGIFAGLSDKKLSSKIEYLLTSEYVNNIYLFRRTSLDSRYKSFNFGKLSRIVIISEISRLAFAFWSCYRKKVNLLIGIYIINHIIYTYYFSKIFKIPYISVIIGDEFSSEEKLNKYYKYISKSSAIIVRGSYTKEMIYGKGFNKDKIYIIPNSFDFNKINQDKVITKNIDFIFTGNLVPIKRLDIMIEAFRILKFKYKIDKFKALIIGNGKLKQSLQVMIEERKLSQNVQIIDFTNEILEYYHKSKVFIMTSEYEGLPMSMIEALACGIPVIMPNLSNISDVVIHGYNGLLVEPLDIEMFAHSMFEMYSNTVLYESLRAGANNFSDEYRYEYSYENIQNHWNRLFKELAS